MTQLDTTSHQLAWYFTDIHMETLQQSQGCHTVCFPTSMFRSLYGYSTKTAGKSSEDSRWASGCLGATPRVNVPKMFLLLWMCRTQAIPCCGLHMWTVVKLSGKCPDLFFRTFSNDTQSDTWLHCSWGPPVKAHSLWLIESRSILYHGWHLSFTYRLGATPTIFTLGSGPVPDSDKWATNTV